MTESKLNLDLEAAMRNAKESSTHARQRRWQQLFTTALEGVCVNMIERIDEDAEDEDEEDEDADAERPERPEDLEEQLSVHAALTTSAAAAVADAALAIEIKRGLVP